MEQTAMWNRRYTSIITLIVLVSMLLNLFTVPEEAYACSCAYQPDPKKALEAAHIVFAGKVLDVKEDVWVDPKEGSVYGWRKAVRFEVNQVWKGVDQKEFIVLTNAGGESACGFDFEIGKSYLVYSYKNNRADKDEWETGTCSRTNLLSAAKPDLEQIGQGQKPSVKVDLSSEMKKQKLVLLYAKAVYVRYIKPKIVYIMPLALLVLIGCLYVFRKVRKK
jgi:hypothetical protein